MSGVRLVMASTLFLATAGSMLSAGQTGNGPDRTVWDGVYTEAQAARGACGVRQSCRTVIRLRRKATVR